MKTRTDSSPFFLVKKLGGNFSLTDHYNHSSFCVANVYLLCEEGHLIVNCAKKQIMLKGSSIVTISQPAGYNWTNVSTDLNLLSPENVSVRVFLKFECEITGTAAFVPLNITRCSLGFIYNESKQVCECVEVADDKSNFLCSRKFGAACVSRGYWFGQVSIGGNTSVYAVVQGAVPEYSSNQPCPPQIMATGGGSDYALLKFHVDDQCSSSRGGDLCRLCRPGYVFTFTALKCVANSTCEPWHPYLVVLISQVFQVVLAITLLCVVRFKVSVGSGYLYGPMLFLSIASSLSITNLRSQYSLLNSFITVVSSLPLLNIEVFGLIPWCFFHPLDKIYNYSLCYLGPLTVLVVILVITFIVRQCPRAMRHLQASPLRAMCFLMILSFWSLAETSVDILTPTIITYSSNSSIYVVSHQPNIRYFSPKHLLVAIPALLILVVLVTPLLTVLLFFPLLSKVFSLHRIKPFLDEFQSCYKDNFRWYAGVYFIAWLTGYFLGSFSAPGSLSHALMIILLVSQLYFQPYQSKLLNMMDGCLLLAINLILLLSRSVTVTNPFNVVVIYGLVIVPVVCLILLSCSMIIIKLGVPHYFCNKFKKHFLNKKVDEDQVDHHSKQFRDSLAHMVKRIRVFNNSEREPLIRIVDYQ